jgi:hypothetical protein
MYEPPVKIILKCLESKWNENNFLIWNQEDILYFLNLIKNSFFCYFSQVLNF